MIFSIELPLLGKSLPPLPGLLPPEQISVPRSVKREPQRALEEFKNALDLFWKGRYDEALKSLDQVIKMDIYSLEPYYWKGIILLRKGLLQEAQRMIEHYLEVKPAELRAIRTLDRIKKTTFPDLIPPEALYPRKYRTISPFSEAREKKGVIDSIRFFFFWTVYNPSAITMGPDGNLYMADFGNGNIMVLSRNGLPIKSFGKLKNPSGIAISPDGRIYVSDFSESKIFVFNLSGELLSSFGEGEILNPQGICIDPYGYLYVCDWGKHRISKYTLDGKFIRSIGDEVLWEPLSVCVDDEGDIWVSDGSERCILRFSGNGLLKDKFLEDVFSRSLFVDFKGRVLVLDEERKSLFLIDKNKIVEKINLPKSLNFSSLCIDDLGNVFLTCFDAPYIINIDTPLRTGKIEIRVTKINTKELPEVNVEVEVSEGWYPLPLERLGLFARIVEDDWIIEPTSVKEIDKPLSIGIIVDPSYEKEAEELLNILKESAFAVDKIFVVGALSAPELPPNRLKWEKNNRPFDGSKLLESVLNILPEKDARRVIVYCGPPPNIGEEDMRRLAYFARLHQIRFFILWEDDLPPLWRSFIAYTGGRKWNISYINKGMPLAYHLRKSPLESYEISYSSLSPEGKKEGKRYLRVFIETPFAHYEDEVTYYIWGDPEKILR